jgi:hypothetical protein
MLGAGLPIISLSIQTGVKLLLLYIFYTVLTTNLSIYVSFLCTQVIPGTEKGFFVVNVKTGAELEANAANFRQKMPLKKMCHSEGQASSADNTHP